jgi:spermidine/putrescine transport system ATP-binding protein
MNQPAVRTDGLVKEYGDVRAVEDVSFEIEEGKFFSLLGPSGCGKTTTLRMLAGFERPTEGSVHIAGENVTDDPPYNRDVGMVFQSYALFPHKTVEENVGFGLKMDGVSPDERDDRVADILDLVGLPGYQDRSPSELSGGQQQRVALARALVIEPSVLLLDEPLSNLDLKLRKEMQFELKRIQTELEITTVYVTHDQEEALSMSDELLVINEGNPEQIGPPREVYNDPVNEFVADFMGESNILQGNIVSQTDETVDVDLQSTEQDPISISQNAVKQSDALDSGAVSLSLRAEDLDIVDSAKTNGGAIDGTVETKTFQGKVTTFLVDIGGEEILIEAPGKRSQDRFEVGDQVSVQWDEHDCLVLSG